MKKLILLVCFVVVVIGAKAQILTPVKWSYGAKKTSSTEAVVFLRATIDKGWHIYSQNMADGGPIKTSFKFTPAPTYVLIGKVIEPKSVTKFEDTFSMNVSYFETLVTFQQKIKLKAGQTTIKGSLEFMVCNDQQCLPPSEVAFSIPVK